MHSPDIPPMRRDLEIELIAEALIFVIRRMREMSAQSDAVQAAVVTLLDLVTKFVDKNSVAMSENATLKTQLAALQAQLDASGSDSAQLDALKAQIDPVIAALQTKVA